MFKHQCHANLLFIRMNYSIMHTFNNLYVNSNAQTIHIFGTLKLIFVERFLGEKKTIEKHSRTNILRKVTLHSLLTRKKISFFLLITSIMLLFVMRYFNEISDYIFDIKINNDLLYIRVKFCQKKIYAYMRARTCLYTHAHLCMAPTKANTHATNATYEYHMI